MFTYFSFSSFLPWKTSRNYSHFPVTSSHVQEIKNICLIHICPPFPWSADSLLLILLGRTKLPPGNIQIKAFFQVWGLQVSLHQYVLKRQLWSLGCCPLAVLSFRNENFKSLGISKAQPFSTEVSTLSLYGMGVLRRRNMPPHGRSVSRWCCKAWLSARNFYGILTAGIWMWGVFGFLKLLLGFHL